MAGNQLTYTEFMGYTVTHTNDGQLPTIDSSAIKRDCTPDEARAILDAWNAKLMDEVAAKRAAAPAPTCRVCGSEDGIKRGRCADCRTNGRF